MQVRGAPYLRVWRGRAAERTRGEVPRRMCGIGHCGIRVERRRGRAGQAPEKCGRQRFAQQRREFRGIAGIRHHRGAPCRGQAQPVFQGGGRPQGVTFRRGKRHAGVPPVVCNSRRQTRYFAAGRVAPPWTDVDMPSVRIRHDVECAERKKPEGPASEPAQAQGGHVMFPVQREQGRPAGAYGAQEHQTGENAGAAGGKSRRKIFLGAHQKQEQAKGQKRRAEEPAKALAAPPLAGGEKEQLSPLTQAGPGEPEFRGILCRCGG